jgi:hypothetical protein
MCDDSSGCLDSAACGGLTEYARQQSIGRTRQDLTGPYGAVWNAKVGLDILHSGQGLVRWRAVKRLRDTQNYHVAGPIIVVYGGGYLWLKTDAACMLCDAVCCECNMHALKAVGVCCPAVPPCRP